MPQIDANGRLINWEFFKEDLLHLCQLTLRDKKWSIDPDGYFIDLGWYPDSEPDGKYVLHIGKGSWQQRVFTFESFDRFEIQRAIDDCIACLQASGDNPPDFSHISVARDEARLQQRHYELPATEAELYLFFAPASDYDNLQAFYAAVACRLLASGYYEDKKRLEKFEHLDSLGLRQLEAMAQHIEAGAWLATYLPKPTAPHLRGRVVADRWDCKEVIFVAGDNYVGMFWTTYA